MMVPCGYSIPEYVIYESCKIKKVYLRTNSISTMSGACGTSSGGQASLNYSTVWSSPTSTEQSVI